ncbi:hypothetical protein [Microbacterium marinilacus]|uniref:hypothetical protein n=1 Tax=Microbacterium marinilacus TaxID=415209 RepID=UPI001C8E841C|nr:hypothetical protein [Microbacterium marinilacus]MBY0687468.1 hypothetical protein [Microbacterium marinilacus]
MTSHEDAVVSAADQAARPTAPVSAPALLSAPGVAPLTLLGDAAASAGLCSGGACALPSATARRTTDPRR